MSKRCPEVVEIVKMCQTNVRKKSNKCQKHMKHIKQMSKGRQMLIKFQLFN